MNTLIEMARDIEKTRSDIITKYGEPSPDNNEQYIVPDDKIEEAAKELNDLFTLEQEVAVNMLKLDWFDGIDIINLEVDRNIVPVSATEVRKAILDNNYIAFTKLVPKRMWITYGTLRSKLIEIKGEK